MNISDLEKFIIDFFTANHCDIMTKEEGKVTVQLTEELDKVLMNRPFYWHYINSIGEKGKPMTLTLITNPERKSEEGEWIHFGSPRLQQIWNYLIEQEKYTLLFEEIHVEKNTALYPWLLTNIKISYKGRQKKAELISLGIQLINGKIIVNMMEELNKLRLKQQISNYCFTLSPLISLTNGYRRVENIVLNYLENQSHNWAIEAQEKLQEEIAILNHFYQDNENDELLEKEIEEIKTRYEPEIKLEVVNGGLVYLNEAL